MTTKACGDLRSKSTYPMVMVAACAGAAKSNQYPFIYVALICRTALKAFSDRADMHAYHTFIDRQHKMPMCRPLRNAAR
jgi:hypothetical protein